jgi:hypothetical protein
MDLEFAAGSLPSIADRLSQIPRFERESQIDRAKER